MECLMRSSKRRCGRISPERLNKIMSPDIFKNRSKGSRLPIGMEWVRTEKKRF